MKAEFLRKKQILDAYMAENGFDGVLFSMKDNEAWFTCGGSCWVGKDGQNGAVDLLYLDGKCYLIAAENEKARHYDEEVAGLGFDFEIVAYPWYENKAIAIEKLIAGKRVMSDTGFAGTENRGMDLIRMRYAMQPEEIERARKLGADCAKAMYETCTEIAPGMTEHEVSAMITGKLMAMGINAPCCLIASDERIDKYRHPIPTFKKIDKLCMIVICGTRDGLVLSMTRLVSFGPLSEDLKKRHLACVRIDARFMERTQIGANVQDVFKAGIEAYAEFGYPEDWKCHHQGGSAGYDSRDYCCNFSTDEIIVANQMFAWNPTVTGTKVEDTFLLTENGREILTEIPGWPMLEVETSVGVLRRPDILVR